MSNALSTASNCWKSTQLQAKSYELHAAAEGANMLRQLLELAMSCQYDSADESMWRPMTEFSATHCETLGELFQLASNGEDISMHCEAIVDFCSHSNNTWGEYLELLAGYDDGSSQQWNAQASDPEPTKGPDDDAISTDQIDQLLQALNQSNQEQIVEAAEQTLEEIGNEQTESAPEADATQDSESEQGCEAAEQLAASVQEFFAEYNQSKSEAAEETPTEFEQLDAHVVDYRNAMADGEFDDNEVAVDTIELTDEGDDSGGEFVSAHEDQNVVAEQSDEWQDQVVDETTDEFDEELAAANAEDFDAQSDAEFSQWEESEAWDESQATDQGKDSFGESALHTDEETENKPSVSELLQGLLESSDESESDESAQDDVEAEMTEFVDSTQDQQDSGFEFQSESVLDSDNDVEESPGSATDEGTADSEENWLPADQLETVASDAEIRDAYLEDAVRCLDQMEKCSLEFEESHDKEETIRLFCRELHTLKGASASVGLTNLASVIHDKETILQNTNDISDEELTDLLLDSVDKMRNVIERIQSGDSVPTEEVSDNPSDSPSAQSTQPQGNQNRPTRPTVSLSSSSSTASSEDALIRIRASKLDRLMDMLAELVVLRNRRESNLGEFNDCNKELTRCAARLSVCQNTRFNREEDDEQFANALGGQLQEIARDISVVASNIRDLQKPVGNDNLSISHFIRDFRQELMQLRRVPTEGLFNRLQRAARDVAKLEDKQLKLNCIGGETGIEQELQEKLYEPLLHIVRNAVSHGIESPEVRTKNGKAEFGTLTLKAQTNSQILVIEISDNGKGLDHEAIRKRGMERGLIKSSDRISDEEVAHLIFHPGFSTRDQATQVSGRGVGMDIVSTTMDQMRGRIDIQSEKNVGTTMRLIVPLRSAIEHVMVFKASDQLFALPTQAVISANRSSEYQRNDLIVHGFSDLLSMPSTDYQDIVILRNTRQGSDEMESIGLRVQEIVGPEEVVLRNLPGLVDNHPLFSGLTLSGAGDTVLLLDSEKLADYATQYQSVTQETSNVSASQSSARKVVLVVDDSLSARKMLVRKLSALGIDTQEAGDGVEALDILRQNKFDLVLTDLDMPRLGGMELLFDLQKRDRYDTPVVVVTSRSQEQFRQQAMDRGAADYLTKPVSDEALGSVLSNLNIVSS